jgi:hypothetical protein
VSGSQTDITRPGSASAYVVMLTAGVWDDRTQFRQSLGFLTCYPQVVLQNQPNGFISSSAQLRYQRHQLLEFRAVSQTDDRN